MVFLASLGVPSDMWDYQMLFLNLKGHRGVAYDRRGHGRSSVPAGGYDYDTLADDLHTVLEARDCTTRCWSAIPWRAASWCAT